MDQYFIITVDTEGDNLWKPVIQPGGMRTVTVKNAEYIERFQQLCEKYRFVPTYLVNYEMATAQPFANQAREWVKEGKCEIGMHLHAWNTPPLHELPYKKGGNNPYACEYPQHVLWEKMKTMTALLEEQFGVRPVSHRGGRWYIDAWYVRALEKLGYIADCSVTPGVSWKGHIGHTCYGQDYTGYPNGVYYMGGKRLDRKRGEGILEVPPTVLSLTAREKICALCQKPFSGRKIWTRRLWLRPNGTNREEMLGLVRRQQKRGSYLEFMIHSSELMPGGSPTFRNRQGIEKLYADLECIFREIGSSYEGISLGSYARQWKRDR